jgi:hypothetical protein
MKEHPTPIQKALAELEKIEQEKARLDAEFRAQIKELDQRAFGIRNFIKYAPDFGVTEAVPEPASEMPPQNAAVAPRSPAGTIQARGPYHGMTLPSAVLALLKTPRAAFLTVREITTQLTMRGFSLPAENLADSVNRVVRRLVTERKLVIRPADQSGKRLAREYGLAERHPELVKQPTPSVAARDLDKHRERTREAMAQMKAQGLHIGRRPALTPELRQEAKEKLKMGLSARRIAASMGISAATLRKSVPELLQEIEAERIAAEKPEEKPDLFH